MQILALIRRPPKKPAIADNIPADAEQQPLPQTKTSKARQIAYWSIVALVIALLISLQPVFAADTIWTKFADVMKDIYGKLLGVSTIIAVTAATVALLVRMISRNQRAVDEATSWLKRITIAWIILNTLGFTIAYLAPWFAGGQYNP